MWRKAWLSVALWCVVCVARGDELVSGPKVGEALPEFKFLATQGDDASKVVEFLPTAEGKPVLLVFVTKRTRPGFGLLRQLDKYGQVRQPEGLVTAIVQVQTDTEDAVKFCQLMRERYGFQGSLYAAPEGQAPKDFGLHEDAEITVLLTDKDHKVVHNLSRRDPMAQDFRELRAAIDKMMGPSPVQFP